MGQPKTEAEIAAWFEQPDLKEFIESRPPRVAAFMREYPACICYRSTQNPLFHYTLYSVSEPNGTGNDDALPLTVTLVHGRDSTMPGVATFGQDPDQLIPCNCGNWEPPSDEQKIARHQHIAAFHEARGRCAACTLPEYKFEHASFCKKARRGKSKARKH